MFAADKHLLHRLLALKTTIFQPTDDQETHVPGGI
jgi:hypothetical protein